jgi:hypothetical protein
MTTEKAAQARLVGVTARVWTHAVFVPSDLPTPPQFSFQTVPREGRPPLVLGIPAWAGMAECGQVVSPVVAGAAHGHDWDTVPNSARCPRCARVTAKSEGGAS